jgi:hypothetical protein
VVVAQTAVLESAIAEERRQNGSLGVGPNNTNNNTVTAITTVVDIVDNYFAIAATVDDHPKPSLEGRGEEETVAVAEVVAPVAAPVVEAAAPEEPESPRTPSPKVVRFALPESEDSKPEDSDESDDDEADDDLDPEGASIVFEDVWSSEGAAEVAHVAEEPEVESVILAEPVNATNTPQQSPAGEPTPPVVEQEDATAGVDCIAEEPESPSERTVKADDIAEEPETPMERTEKADDIAEEPEALFEPTVKANEEATAEEPETPSERTVKVEDLVADAPETSLEWRAAGDATATEAPELTASSEEQAMANVAYYTPAPMVTETSYEGEDAMDVEPLTKSETETSNEEEEMMDVEHPAEPISVVEQREGVDGWRPAYEPQTATEAERAVAQEVETAWNAFVEVDTSEPAGEFSLTDEQWADIQANILWPIPTDDDVAMTETETSNEEEDCVMGELPTTSADDQMDFDEPVQHDDTEMDFDEPVWHTDTQMDFDEPMQQTDTEMVIDPRLRTDIEMAEQWANATFRDLAEDELMQAWSAPATQQQQQQQQFWSEQQPQQQQQQQFWSEAQPEVALNDAATEEATLALLAAYHADAETAPAEEDSLLHAPAFDDWAEFLRLREEYSDVSDTSLTDDDMEHLGYPRRVDDDDEDDDSLFGGAFSGDEAEEEEADEDTQDEHDGIAYVIHNGLTLPITPTATPAANTTTTTTSAAYGPATAGLPIPIDFGPTTSVPQTTPAAVQPVSQSVFRADSPVTTAPAPTTTAPPTEVADAEPAFAGEVEPRLVAVPPPSPSVPAGPPARRVILPARGRLARLAQARAQAEAQAQAQAEAQAQVQEPVVAESSRMGAAAGVAAAAAAAAAANAAVNTNSLDEADELSAAMLAELAVHEMQMAAEAGVSWGPETVEDGGEGDAGSDGKEMADAQAEEDALDPKGKGKGKANAGSFGTETAAAEEDGLDSDDSDGEDPADPKGKGKAKAKPTASELRAEARAAVQAAIQAQQARAAQIAREFAEAAARSALRQRPPLTEAEILRTGEQVPRFLPQAKSALAKGEAALAGIRAANHAKWAAKVGEDKEDNILWDDSTEEESEEE